MLAKREVVRLKQHRLKCGPACNRYLHAVIRKQKPRLICENLLIPAPHLALYCITVNTQLRLTGGIEYRKLVLAHHNLASSLIWHGVKPLNRQGVDERL